MTIIFSQVCVVVGFFFDNHFKAEFGPYMWIIGVRVIICNRWLSLMLCRLSVLSLLFFFFCFFYAISKSYKRKMSPVVGRCLMREYFECVANRIMCSWGDFWRKGVCEHEKSDQITFHMRLICVYMCFFLLSLNLSPKLWRFCLFFVSALACWCIQPRRCCSLSFCFFLRFFCDFVNTLWFGALMVKVFSSATMNYRIKRHQHIKYIYTQRTPDHAMHCE